MKLNILKIKNQYIYFLIKLSLFLFVLIIIDKSVGYTLNYYYFQQKAGLQYRTTYSMEITKANVLIIGSSRANHHYHPDIFENKLNLSFYNTGRDGSNIIFYNAILKSILIRYTPKIIILDIKSGEFAISLNDYDRLSTLLPYYKSHPEIRPIIELRSSYEKFKLLSEIYPYNSSVLTIAFGNMKFTQKKLQDNKGYIALYKQIKLPFNLEKFENQYPIDSIKLKNYIEFIRQCKKSNIKLYIVCSPYLSNTISEDYSITLGNEIAKRYKIDFYDYSKNKYFIERPILFQDYGHLNDEGAKIFSSMLIDSIKHSDPELYNLYRMK